MPVWRGHSCPRPLLLVLVGVRSEVRDAMREPWAEKRNRKDEHGRLSPLVARAAHLAGKLDVHLIFGWGSGSPLRQVASQSRRWPLRSDCGPRSTFSAS